MNKRMHMYIDVNMNMNMDVLHPIEIEPRHSFKTSPERVHTNPFTQ